MRRWTSGAPAHQTVPSSHLSPPLPLTLPSRVPVAALALQGLLRVFSPDCLQIHIIPTAAGVVGAVEHDGLARGKIASSLSRNHFWSFSYSQS